MESSVIQGQEDGLTQQAARQQRFPYNTALRGHEYMYVHVTETTQAMHFT